MLDITGKEIEPGDLLMEIYKNGERLFFHVVYGGFTPKYVRTANIQYGTFKISYNEKLRKGQVKPNRCLVLTEEQFLRAVENWIRPREDEDADFQEMELQRQKFNILLEFSREIKQKQV